MTHSTLASGVQLLRSRYSLIRRITHSDPRNISQTWLAVDEDDVYVLVKAWPFDGDRPDDLQRALWDAELRTLYRVGSSPGAQDTILVIKDAGVDKEAHCFAMVLQAPGYEPLADALEDRARTPWHNTQDLQIRRSLWRGLAQLVDGIALLHEQQMIHRDIRPETIYFAGDLGPASLRLGGFEWSVRVGRPADNAPPRGWSSPPEFFRSESYGYRLETDWFGFGMLAARLLLKVEAHSESEPIERHARVLREIERPGNRLTDMERVLLGRLIAPDPLDRVSRGHEVSTAVKDVVRALEQGGGVAEDRRPLVVVINPMTSQLVDRAIDLGFQPDPTRSQEPFNPHDTVHCARLSDFIRRDLRTAQLYAVSNASFYILVGAQFVIRLTQFEYPDTDSGDNVRSWAFAYCQGITDLRWNEGGTAYVNLSEDAIVVRTRRQVIKEKAVRQNARSWERYLPTIDRTVQLRAHLAQFHHFIRCTNQLELLIRDSEIFRYRAVQRTEEDGVVRLVIKEEPRPRPPVAFAATEGGMCEYLSREIESNKPDCKQVVLTPEDEDALSVPRIRKTERWSVERVDLDDERVHLVRVSSGGPMAAAPDDGILRTWGMFGQVALIRRRKRAIDRLEKHTYLLRSLSAPGQVYMDTGAQGLPVPLPSHLVDEAKQAAIEDILRVRPIYALQGPPGTGKTTLVAHLLRQLFEDDPVSQVLIAAQAHGAVDVLRAKVRDEAFRGVPEDRQPLAVRLGLSTDGTGFEEGSVEEVSRRVLEAARVRLEAVGERAPLQNDWLETVRGPERSLATWEPGSTVPDFCEIVKRGANVTYCTTSAGDLETLAEETHSFDWTIIEEAGKAHGFDLALPLQAGHRWLLIGDHKQLPPYRFKDYRAGIDSLDDAVIALENLPQRAGGLLDVEWIREWGDRTSEERARFKEYARTWLNTFETVFDYCSRAAGDLKRTIGEPAGAAAGILSQQHRMHPAIGDLVSTCYYDSQLVNRTVGEDGRPLARVRHGLPGIPGLDRHGVLWLDLPWAARDARASEIGPRHGRPRYTNPAEVSAIVRFFERLEGVSADALEVAILAGYNQQVAAIRREVTVDLVNRAGLRVKDRLNSRREVGVSERSGRVAHTVDSFQGNQAGVIVVSLVRNNQLLPGQGLGFLDEASRLCVLLSRAERLLVLVGSWEFFEHQMRATNVDDRHLPLWHWKKIVTTLDAWFREGRALKVAAKELS